jgi:uncharacterized membrane protein YeaQ/YmgE (transglycosylase-associated protein family)
MIDLLYYILLGLVAGWLAARLLKEKHIGLLGSMALGVVGAIIGAYVFEFLGISYGGIVGNLVSALVGAIILIYIIRAVRRL